MGFLEAQPVNRYGTESFRSPFSKRWRGIGAAPRLARRNERKSFTPKAQEGGRKQPGGLFPDEGPTHGVPLFMFSEMFLGGKPGTWCRHD